ncbi:MAG TPA: DUF3352 domain-containing protein [Thermomicrobiales bacterium]|nr:DUF3352 domain-containing protein [Thermomicrobiales bacterium]
MHSPPTQSNLRSTFSRMAIAGALLFGGFASLIQEPASAQADALLSVSSVMPKDTLVYGETKLDSTSDQFVQLDALLTRLGSDESLSEAISDEADFTDDINLDLEGAEVGIGFRPSAFETATNAVAEISTSDLGSIGSDAEDAADDASTDGMILVVKPVDISSVASDLKTSTEVTRHSTHADIEIYSDDSDGFVAVVGDFVVLATTVEDIEAVIDTADNAADSLASVDTLAQASGLLPQERVAFAWSNNTAAIELAATSSKGMADGVRDIFSNYEGVSAMAIVATEVGLRFDEVNIPAGAPAQASGTADTLDFATKVPANTVLFANGNELGQTVVLKSVGLFLSSLIVGVTSEMAPGDATATPVAVSVDDAYAQLESLLGFNFKTDFMDQMTGPYGFALWNLDANNPAKIAAVLTSQVDTPDKVDNTISTVVNLIQLAGQGSLSVTSHTVPGGSLNNILAPVDGDSISIDFGLIGDQFVLGIGDGAETALTGATDSLADSDVFKTAMSELPTEYQAIYFANVQELQAASEDSGMMGSGNLLDEITSQQAASNNAVESFAAVTYVKDGATFTSAIIIVK